MKLTENLVKIKEKDHLNEKLKLNPSINKDLNIKISRLILAEFMKFRRISKASDACKAPDCEYCLFPHLSKVLNSVIRNEPISFVLPAFPGKSPNTQKVLSPLPDYAEELSLNFLNQLCHKVKAYYPPGAKIILCSDGRVFSDIVGMKESDVSSYQAEIKHLISKKSFSYITSLNLEDFYNDLNFNQMRDELMKRYGAPLDLLKHKISKGSQDSANHEEKEARRIYSGITRFLFEDALHPGQSKSRTAIQKDARLKAYEVIRRSNAWSELIAEHFPQAVRLSIHPQACGSKKLGIRLISNESWMTPWHGVALETENGFILLKKSEAESLKATLVRSSTGRASHYRLLTNKTIP